MEFEWNPDKAALNVGKHDVTFQEAATVFDDSATRQEKRFYEEGN